MTTKDDKMPRGVSKSGFRNTKNNSNTLTKMMNVSQTTLMPEIVETDAEIETKLRDRFEILEMMAKASITGDVRSLIVSGPAGLGKSYTIDKVLSNWDPEEKNHSINKGYVRATALYKMLYQHRDKGKVLVFDDADRVFFDDVAIGLLKAVCDSSKRRIVTYATEGVLIDEISAEVLPKSFQFDGSIIFISNYDFDAMIYRGDKLSPHLEAMVSRSLYIDLGMKNTRDYLVRIRQVVAQGLIADVGLTKKQQDEVIDYIEENHSKLRELSLRMALKISTIYRVSPKNWKTIAKITCHKS
jgi:hypothetical protein